MSPPDSSFPSSSFLFSSDPQHPPNFALGDMAKPPNPAKRMEKKRKFPPFPFPPFFLISRPRELFLIATDFLDPPPRFMLASSPSQVGREVFSCVFCYSRVLYAFHLFVFATSWIFLARFLVGYNVPGMTVSLSFCFSFLASIPFSSFGFLCGRSEAWGLPFSEWSRFFSSSLELSPAVPRLF